MKSLVLFRYVQPVEGSSFRWGVLTESRDTKKNRLLMSTIHGNYRRWDHNFLRTRTIDTVLTLSGIKAFYRERNDWRIEIPWLGSLVKPFLAKFSKKT